MKKFAWMMIVGLFALGCSGHAKKNGGTCPHKNKQEQKAEPSGSEPAQDESQLKDTPMPAGTGYGSDPGEESQE